MNASAGAAGDGGMVSSESVIAPFETDGKEWIIFPMQTTPLTYPKIDADRKTGDEPFTGVSAAPGLKLLDFWQWAASDLVSNAMRGVLAEYIVATALGLDTGIRTEWDAFDLLTTDGKRIEVKSGAYLQSWGHKELSKIIFGIRPTKGWDASTNTVSLDLKRQADIYVFCVLSHQVQDTMNPLDLDQWDFYVLGSRILNEKFPVQKTIGLSSLLKLNPVHVKYAGIAKAVSEPVVEAPAGPSRKG